jgi:hypothetical protein
MKRRDFFKFLVGAFPLFNSSIFGEWFERLLWVPKTTIIVPGIPNDCSLYYNYLLDRAPHFDSEILKNWYPTDDSWIGHFETGEWSEFNGAELLYDRLHIEFPNIQEPKLVEVPQRFSRRDLFRKLAKPVC